jgi:hypothetical protein
MNPVSLELTKLRALAALTMLVVLLALAGAAGWVVNGWRLRGPHAVDLAARDTTIRELRAGIDQQNVAILRAGDATKAAEDRGRLAERMAAQAVDGMRARGAAVEASQATDCAGVLRESWGAWK